MMLYEYDDSDIFNAYDYFDGYYDSTWFIFNDDCYDWLR